MRAGTSLRQIYKGKQLTNFFVRGITYIIVSNDLIIADKFSIHQPLVGKAKHEFCNKNVDFHFSLIYTPRLSSKTSHSVRSKLKLWLNMSDTPEGKILNPIQRKHPQKACSGTAGFKARKITVNPCHKAWVQYKQSMHLDMKIKAKCRWDTTSKHTDWMRNYKTQQMKKPEMNIIQVNKRVKHRVEQWWCWL